MSELKMSDVFDLPVFSFHDCILGAKDSTDTDFPPLIVSELFLEPAEMTKAIADVINSHDSMVEQLAKQQEEIADYKKLLTEILEEQNCGWHIDVKVERVLAKHNKGE